MWIRRTAALLRWSCAITAMVIFFVLVAGGDLTRGSHGIHLVYIGVSGLCLSLAFVMVCRWERARYIRQRLLLMMMGGLIGFALTEAYVRVFEPFPISLRGSRIRLPIHQQKLIRDHGIEGLDDPIRVSFNSLGFRGPEPPADWDSRLSVLCVGGSTTQCIFVSDGKDWPTRLSQRLSTRFERVWVNNAGLDGHSTFGHLHLVEQYVARFPPKVMLLFVGINDVGRADVRSFDRLDVGYRGQSLAMTTYKALIRHSDAFALANNLARQQLAKSRGLVHQVGIARRGGFRNLNFIDLTESERDRFVRDHAATSLDGYRMRLRELIETSRSLGTRVVLITQPALYGEGVDDVTGINLERVSVRGIDGWTSWQLLQQCNQVTVQVGDDMRVPVIEIAETMPKSSRYYYDFIHYNNDGAKLVATLIDAELSPILRRWYPEFYKTQASNGP